MYFYSLWLKRRCGVRNDLCWWRCSLRCVGACDRWSRPTLTRFPPRSTPQRWSRCPPWSSRPPPAPEPRQPPAPSHSLGWAGRPDARSLARCPAGWTSRRCMFLRLRPRRPRWSAAGFRRRRSGARSPAADCRLWSSWVEAEDCRPQYTAAPPSHPSPPRGPSADAGTTASLREQHDAIVWDFRTTIHTNHTNNDFIQSRNSHNMTSCIKHDL